MIICYIMSGKHYRASLYQYPRSASCRSPNIGQSRKGNRHDIRTKSGTRQSYTKSKRTETQSLSTFSRSLSASCTRVSDKDVHPANRYAGGFNTTSTIPSSTTRVRVHSAALGERVDKRWEGNQANFPMSDFQMSLGIRSAATAREWDSVRDDFERKHGKFITDNDYQRPSTTSRIGDVNTYRNTKISSHDAMRPYSAYSSTYHDFSKGNAHLLALTPLPLGFQ